MFILKIMPIFMSAIQDFVKQLTPILIIQILPLFLIMFVIRI